MADMEKIFLNHFGKGDIKTPEKHMCYLNNKSDAIIECTAKQHTERNSSSERGTTTLLFSVHPSFLFATTSSRPINNGRTSHQLLLYEHVLASSRLYPKSLGRCLVSHFHHIQEQTSMYISNLGTRASTNSWLEHRSHRHHSNVSLLGNTAILPRKHWNPLRHCHKCSVTRLLTTVSRQPVCKLKSKHKWYSKGPRTTSKCTGKWS